MKRIIHIAFLCVAFAALTFTAKAAEPVVKTGIEGVRDRKYENLKG